MVLLGKDVPGKCFQPSHTFPSVVVVWGCLGTTHVSAVAGSGFAALQASVSSWSLLPLRAALQSSSGAELGLSFLLGNVWKSLYSGNKFLGFFPFILSNETKP